MCIIRTILLGGGGGGTTSSKGTKGMRHLALTAATLDWLVATYVVYVLALH